MAITPQVINQTSQMLVVSELSQASTFWLRLKGLLGTSELKIGAGLLLRPCDSVHTIGMRYGIDVLFLSRDLKVLKVIHSMPPMRAACCFKSAMVLELPAGTAAKTKTDTGHYLEIK